MSCANSVLPARVLRFFLWFHYLHLGRIGIQFIYSFTAAGLGLCLLNQSFSYSSMVERKNEDLLRELVPQYPVIGLR